MGHGAQAWLLLCVLVTPLPARPLPPNSTSQGAGPPWFQYPDDDTAKIRAAYRYMGEQPVLLAANPLPRLLRGILLGSVLLTLLFFLHQICSTMVCGQQS